ncbi:DNA repair exonuclease SbcCD ATPase subunit [Paenibacillus sp. 1182]|uniref:AAA family ATPase n=1 Tax=Paenibacillus sp. 1182 TaxID=2806565 RepID=UPI001AE6F954|nr:AAA family ATPase [Paenibacillus sp. 1182]MBP1309208.1 DNA repair exonuclease SbcCD ATPase subunit [Paenibacillus sp. 1182]
MSTLLKSFKLIQLIKVQVQGFRGFKDAITIPFDLGKNEFLGDNGKGKSSIGELLAWIMTGRNIAGKQKEINVINKDTKSVVGILTFMDQDGNMHELERKQTSSMSIKLDYETIPQKRLEELIPMDLFLSAFNPMFLLSLDETILRRTVANLFPNQTKEEILAEMDDFKCEVLRDEVFLPDQSNEYLKNRNAELKELDDKRKWLEGYMGKLIEKVLIPEPHVFDETPLIAVQKQLEELNARKPLLKDLREILKKRNEIQQKLAQAQHQTFEQQTQKSELLKEKALLEQKLEVEMSKQYTPFNPAHIEAKLSILRSDYKHNFRDGKLLEEEANKLSTRHVHVKEGEQCPYCKQTISEASLKVLATELAMEVAKETKQLEIKKKEKQKTLAELEKEGNNLLSEIKKSKEEDEKKRKQFEECRTKAIQNINNRLKAISVEVNSIANAEKAFEVNKNSLIKSLQAEMHNLGVDKLEAENSRIEREFNSQVSIEKTKLQSELKVLQKQKEEVFAHEAERKALQKSADERLKDLQVREKEMNEYIEMEQIIRNKIYCIKEFNAKKIEILTRKIKKHLKNVEIRLQRPVESTGLLKDCFEIYYEGKELKICSNSEIIRAGLEISNMVSSLSNVKFPVFVDNGESITSYEDPGFQTIEVRVVKDKPLTMIKGGKEIVIHSIKTPVKSSKPKKIVHSHNGSSPGSSVAAV